MRFFILTIVLIILLVPCAFCNETKEEIDERLKIQVQNEDWPGALENANLGLKMLPGDEAYLKIKANAYWNMDRFDESIETYKRLVELYPTPRYKANLEEIKAYKIEYEHAKRLLENVDSNNWDMRDIIPLTPNIMYMEQKIDKSYQLIKKFALQDMALVHSKMEDLFLLEQNTLSKEERHKASQEFDNDPILVKLKRANVFQATRHTAEAKKLYDEVLAVEPQNIDAQMGLGYLKLNERDFGAAREIFEKIYEEHPDYTDAKIAVSNSYSANAQYLSALEVLDELPETEKTAYLRGLIYSESDMFNSSRDAVLSDNSARADELRQNLRKKTGLQLIPRYAFYNQILANTFRLYSDKIGFNLQEGLGKNISGVFSYTGIKFLRGRLDGNEKFGNVVNDINFITFGRPKKRFDFQSSLGGRFYNKGSSGTPAGAMLLTDNWLGYHFSDNLNAQLGFSRLPNEESFLAAAGVFVEPGVLAGRVSDNRLYLNVNQRLPRRAYAYFRGGLGLRKGDALPTNPYADGLMGIGKVVYDNHENPFFNIVAIDINTYNSGFRYNVLELFGSNSLFGVYYSPPYFNANSLNLRAEGYSHNIRLRYGVKAFVASQTAPGNSPDTKVGVCAVPYISYAPNDRLTVNVVFHYSNFANVQKYYAMFQLHIKLFRK